MMGFTIFQKWSLPKTLTRYYSDDVNKLQAPHKVDNLEKRFLVWTGKYKSVDEVPAFVGQNVMERARNRMRIKIANYMIAGTALGCVLMIYLGKRDAKEGKSVQQQNIDWHRRINEEDRKAKADVAAQK